MAEVFSTSDLKQKTGEVLNEAQRAGWVKVKSRSRPDMVLVTQEYLDDLLKLRDDIINKLALAMVCAHESIEKGDADSAKDWLINSIEGLDVCWPKDSEDLNEWFNNKLRG